MQTVGILYICTAGYNIFWEDFYKTSEKYFLGKNFNRQYFVFTDDINLDFKDRDNVTVIDQDALNWPFPTLYRFKIFNKSANLLKQTDYLFFFNANMLFVDYVDEDILPLEKGIDFSFALQPWRLNKTPQIFDYERRQKSLACIQKPEGKHYFAGGLNGGKTKAYLDMSLSLEKNIDLDLKKGIIAKWHDESHLNRFALDNESRVKVLDINMLYLTRGKIIISIILK